MTELLTAAQMRAIEQAAIDAGEVTGLELMERAGQSVVEAIFEEWPELKATSHRAVVLCGPGNNGGDGFVVARLLKEWGWEVDVFLYGDPEKLPPDARVNYERWLVLGPAKLMGFPVPRAEIFEELWPSVTGHGFSRQGDIPDLVVDGLFGTGLDRAARSLEHVFALRSDCRPSEWGGARWVAVDFPSGLCSDSGRTYRPKDTGTRIPQVLDADLTVTFGYGKVGHYLSTAPKHCGSLVIQPIGLPHRDVEEFDDFLAEVELDEFATLTSRVWGLGKSERHDLHFGHKYDHGHALILSGPAGKGGAARLAARGALRIGAGLVTLGGPTSVWYEHNAQINAIMWREVKGAPGLKEMLEDDDRLNALCLGPGMGLGHGTTHMVRAALEAGRATVLDADALTQFQRAPQVLFDALHENVVLTPHAGEFARLFPDIAEKLDAPATTGPAYSKVDATREAAARAGCTVLFKGPDTVIANPDGTAASTPPITSARPPGSRPLARAMCSRASSPASSRVASRPSRPQVRRPGSTSNARCPSAPASSPRTSPKSSPRCSGGSDFDRCPGVDTRSRH